MEPERLTPEIFPLEAGLDESTLTETSRSEVREILELIGDEIHEMDPDDFANGRCTPVFFGSALNNFGLDLFLKYFADMAPSPKPYTAEDEQVRSIEAPFSGFIFKMQANMNPDHRDCTAFVRVASGVFRRGIEVTLSNTGKKVRMTTPHSLMGDERNLLETAYPGDIVALF